MNNKVDIMQGLQAQTNLMIGRQKLCDNGKKKVYFQTHRSFT